MHSGAVCPGLIEAGRRQERLSTAARCIPGQSAPASLKQNILESSLLSTRVHSGAVCPGLIEARSVVLFQV